MKTEAPLLCWTNSQFNNKSSNKKAWTTYIVVMMAEIKPFLFVCFYDKIEPEEAKRLKTVIFSFISLFLFSPGCIVFVLPILGEKIGMSTILKGAEWNSNSSGGKTAILQLSDCVIWAFKKPDFGIGLLPNTLPGKTEGFISPLSACHITVRKIILCFQCLNNSHILAWH